MEYLPDLVAGAWVVAPSGTSIEFDVPPPPQLVATVGPTVVLTTSDESATLPDLSVVGLGYPADGAYRWNATAIAAADYATSLRFAVDFYDLIGFGGSGKDGDVGFAFSAACELTLAPF